VAYGATATPTVAAATAGTGSVGGAGGRDRSNGGGGGGGGYFGGGGGGPGGDNTFDTEGGGGGGGAGSSWANPTAATGVTVIPGSGASRISIAYTAAATPVSRPTLPATGVTITPLIGIGLVALLLGFGIVVRVPRRRPSA
ncbi:MAG TPA: hypothetical protein VJT31_07785, partial [Rugosimonospora sp.]|nr:hypothetical protein [Rugosimonospora sp.]